MSPATWKRLAAIPALYLLFFYGMTRTGLIGPDEPRYASIGREMARSGDWITPRLWGEPWFEKPPLLYWMVGAANLAGLGPDLAPRIPVALLSVGFLLLYYRLLRAEFGTRAATFSTIVLGASVAWVAFSQVGVTDLPMSAAFSAAMLFGLRWLSTGDRRQLLFAAPLLALAVLAKGLVPLALALPMLWAGRRRMKDLLHPLPVALFLLTAVPWYVLCALRNGRVFLDVFFGEHHFTRFFSGVALHPQPFWFYLPVLLAGLFPWSPMVLTLFRKKIYRDPRCRFLLLWFLFGFVFFSASRGKLPGYLLPLFPALAALVGIALDELKSARWLLAASGLTLTLIPVASRVLPDALAGGLSRSAITGWDWRVALICAVLAAWLWWLDNSGRRGAAIGLLFAAAVAGVLYGKVVALPEVDRLVSARPLWKAVAADPARVCVDNIHRNWRYSLNYYSVTPLLECSESPRPVRIEQLPDLPPAAVPGSL